MMQGSAMGVSCRSRHNGAECVDALEAIVAQADGRPMEIIVVDDGGDDGSSELLRRLALIWPLDVVRGEGLGAAAAINTGVRAARYPIVCQIDQDVVVLPGWMQRLVDALDDPDVGAAQGYYTSDPRATRCARAMGLDLEQRYAAMAPGDTGHVCTGNSAYRASALHGVGPFDETLGYGYDNDMSYRLREAGHRLAFCADARSIHRWREGFVGYLLQQYGFGYGRIDLVAKHPHRVGGDSVSPAGMMLHPLVMALAVAGAATALAMALASGPWRPVALGAVLLVAALAVERTIAGVRAARRFRDATALLFPALHLARDLAWVAAMAIWTARFISRRPRNPFDSMRPGARPGQHAQTMAVPQHLITESCLRPARVLGIIPAFSKWRRSRLWSQKCDPCGPASIFWSSTMGRLTGHASLLQRLDAWLRFPESSGSAGRARGLLCRAAAALRSSTAMVSTVLTTSGGCFRAAAAEVDVVMGSRCLGQPRLANPLSKRPRPHVSRC